MDRAQETRRAEIESLGSCPKLQSLAIVRASGVVAYPDLQEWTFAYLGYPVPTTSVAIDDALLLSIPPFTLPSGFIRHFDSTDPLTDSVRTFGFNTVEPTSIITRAPDHAGGVHFDPDFGQFQPGFSGVPPGVFWSAFNVANPTNRILLFRGVPSISAGPAGLKAQVVEPAASSSPPFVRVDFFVSRSWSSFGTDVNCYLGSSSTVVTTAPGTQRFYTYVLSASTRNRNCVGIDTLAVVPGEVVTAVGVSAAGDALARLFFSTS